MLSKNIRNYRKQAKKTQSQIAESSGMSEKTISNYERGQLRIIEQRLQSLADALGVTLMDLFKK